MRLNYILIVKKNSILSNIFKDMSHVMRKQTMWFPTGSDTNQAVQTQKTIPRAKTKVLISFAVTAKLICTRVFTYAKCCFSHYMAHYFLPL